MSMRAFVVVMVLVIPLFLFSSACDKEQPTSEEPVVEHATGQVGEEPGQSEMLSDEDVDDRSGEDEGEDESYESDEGEDEDIGYEPEEEETDESDESEEGESEDEDTVYESEPDEQA